jgi:hypothetical protein
MSRYSCTHGAQINFGDLTPYLTYGLTNGPIIFRIQIPLLYDAYSWIRVSQNCATKINLDNWWFWKASFQRLFLEASEQKIKKFKWFGWQLKFILSTILVQKTLVSNLKLDTLLLWNQLGSKAQSKRFTNSIPDSNAAFEMSENHQNLIFLEPTVSWIQKRNYPLTGTAGVENQMTVCLGSARDQLLHKLPRAGPQVFLKILPKIRDNK